MTLKRRKWGRPGSGRQALAGLFLGTLVLFSAAASHAEPARRSLELELDDIPGVTGYEIRVTRILGDKTKKSPIVFKVKGTKWSAKLLPGHYTMEVRSVDSRHVPGVWSAPQDLDVKLQAAELVSPLMDTKINSKDAKEDTVTLEWKPVDGAEKYKVKIMKADTPDAATVKETVETGTSVKVTLPVAQKYAWSVTPMMENDLEGDTNEFPPKFDLIGAPLDKPSLTPVDEINTSEFEWNAPKFAQKYDFKVEALQKDGEWKEVINKTLTQNRYLGKDPLPSGVYRARVLAHGNLRADSDTSEAKFKTLYVNTRSPAAIEQVKTEASYETKSIVFGVASYFITFVNYKGQNADRSVSTNTSFNAIGGTGRLGLGTWFKEDSQIGVMTAADLSGYTINGATSTYYSQTLEGVYRERLGALGKLRVHFGAVYRDIPCTIADQPGTQLTHQSDIATAGPLLALNLAHGFSRKLGAQINAQVTDSLIGIKTPNGQANQPALSFQLGLLGSLNMGPNLVGFMGYAYREEHANYGLSPASTLTGQNTSVLSGHYVNFLLEYGF